MVGFIAVAQAMQHFNSIFHAGFFHIDRSKTSLKGGILLDKLVELVQGGGTNALQLAARQGRFEHIGGIHGALGSPRSHHGMQFIDHEDDFASGALDFLDGGFEAFLKLTTEAAASDHRTQVKRDHAFARQDLGHIVGSDLLRQSFHYGGLPHAGFTDQDRVVLGAAGEDLDDTHDLIIAPDDRVQLAFTRQLGQIT